MQAVRVKQIGLLLVFLLAIQPLAFPQDIYRVQRVVDGDTIVLDNGLKVRLVGADTPETKHPNKPVEYYGKEASAFTKRMCEGKRVRLEYDWEKTGQVRQDPRVRLRPRGRDGALPQC